MKLLAKTLLVGVTSLVLSPLAALALPPDCPQQCTPEDSCSLVCARPGTAKVITCGQWGVCNKNALRHADAAPEASAAEERVCREPARTEPVRTEKS